MRNKIILSAVAMVAVIALPLLVLGATTKYTSLNITDYIKNSKGTLELKDKVKVTDDLNVKDLIKNTATDMPVLIDDSLSVTGNITVPDGITIDGVDVSTLTNSGSSISLDTGSGLTLTNSVLSLQKTCTDGQILKYNNTITSWECSTDVATVSQSSMTVGSGLSLSEAGVLAVSGVTTDMITDGTIATGDLGTDAVGATQLSSSAINAGDIEMADLPTGGAWALSSSLNFDSGTLIVNPTTNSVGIGGAPTSALFVQNGLYAQFANYSTSPPADTDCDSNAERGRIFLLNMMGTYKFVVCGGADGWYYVDLLSSGGGPA